MKYLIFCFALAVGAQSGTPPASSNARTLGGKPPCSATITSNCISSAEYGAAAGAGDVLGAASVQSGRVPYGSGTASTITSSSKFAYNDTTGMGLIPPLSLGQNGTAAGRINFLGSTSGSLPMEADATAAKVTITGNLEVSGTITAGGTGANELTQIAAPSAPAAGKLAYYADSTSATFAVKNPAGVVSHTVQTKAAVTNQVVSAIADDGTVTTRALASGDIPNNAANTSGLAGTATALAANGANCSANQFPKGVDASGASESCAALVAADLPATPLITPGTSITLTGPRAYAVCTGTCTVSVPVPAAGYEFCVMNDNNVATAITLSALGSSAMYENSARTAYGTAGTGTLVLSAAAANRVCIVGRDSTHYLTVSYNGTVTVN